jgi:dTDP-4-dehydrorhamnose reductase
MRCLILGGKTPLRVVDDQVGCPTYTPYLARAIYDLASSGHTGLLHYRNRGVTSWHGFTQEIAHQVRTEGGFLPPEDVIPVPTTEFPRPAPRPAYSVLDVTAFETLVGRRVEPWQAGLTAYLDSLGGNDE